MTEPFLLPVHEIRLAPVLPCGLAPLTLYAIAATLRNTHDPVDPVEVEQRGGQWHLVDGRHRLIASVIAGRADIRCVEADPGR